MKYNSESHARAVMGAMNKLLPGQLMVTCARNEDDGSPVLCIFQRPTEAKDVFVVSLDLKDAESLLPLVKGFIGLTTPLSTN
jgi:hypothetical protein